jgi:hypothetical protein
MNRTTVLVQEHSNKEEDVLEKAIESIQQRFLVPYQTKITSVCERAEPLYLTLDLQTLERLYYRQLDILAVERAVKVLQKFEFWESLYKGVLHYVCEHPFNKDTLNEMVDVIGKCFSLEYHYNRYRDHF